jgi:pyruvate,water dikinase
VVGVTGETGLLRAVQVVWASLWSDAALLYRKEIGLDPGGSRMAVLVQPMVEGGPSGVAFGRDPRDETSGRAIVEAVPGTCRELVDGEVDPDRYVLDRETGELLDWRRGDRPGPAEPLLGATPLAALREALARAEGLLHGPPDLEWTFGDGDLTILQARPITPAAPVDSRAWYLTLTPGDDRLRRLSRRVAGVLIPELAAEGERLAATDLSTLDDVALAAEIEARSAALERWRRIYRDEFIPFAHGVRRLAVYYQEAVRPADPYEFVGLLTGQDLLAKRRNQTLADLGDRVRANVALLEAARAVARGREPIESLRAAPGGAALLEDLDELCRTELDVEYGGERLGRRPEVALHVLIESRAHERTERDRKEDLLARLIDAVGSEREAEAREILEIGQLSWRLRDDDNLLVGRVESQLLRAIGEGASRLRAAERLAADAVLGEAAAAAVAAALRGSTGPVRIPDARPTEPAPLSLDSAEKPRQLVGQPSAPGIASGPVCRVRSVTDMRRFRSGDILVCDAIQPSITHLVPLAAAVVERRGGMLIHGAIIARELGIPCVNGIPRVADLLEDGETITVDGWLGIVTVGPAELDRERGT